MRSRPRSAICSPAETLKSSEGNLDSSELAALYRSADVLLSLHRAEGFGLPMAEAMAHGVPVVATGWSGNLTFMSAGRQPSRSVHARPGQRRIRVSMASSVWAEPDLDDAAKALRRLAEQPEYYARLAAAAHRRVSETAPCFPFAAPGARAARTGGLGRMSTACSVDGAHRPTGRGCAPGPCDPASGRAGRADCHAAVRAGRRRAPARSRARCSSPCSSRYARRPAANG